MQQSISKAVEAYESGRVTRRQLVEGLTAIAAAAGAGGAAMAQTAGAGAVVRGAPTMISDMTDLAASAPFRPTGIDHISILVENLERSAEFYARLFGLRAVSEDTDHRILRLANDAGQIVVSVREKQPFGAVDHYSFKVDSLNQAQATEIFAQHGLTASYHVEYGYYVIDPDGAVVQLV